MEIITKTYGGIRGVDYAREPRRVNDNRSPNMVNMWKNYNKDSECITTREGFVKLADFTEFIDSVTSLSKEVFGIHIYDVDNNEIALIHIGTYLFKWEKFPEALPSNVSREEILLSSSMATQRSSSFMFGGSLYILDGLNYQKFNGEKLVLISEDRGTRINELMLSCKYVDQKGIDVPFVPTTTISRLPNGSGDVYQDVNVLTGWRKNSFVGDGKEKSYHLDTSAIYAGSDSAEYIKVWINDTFIESGGTQIGDVTIKVSSIDTANGIITFDNPPPAPNTLGADNVVILFYKPILFKGEPYQARINHCNLVATYDNRWFFSGNSHFKNAVFHSELNNPEYISDLNYYQDGSENEAVTSLVSGGSILWVFKEGKENGNNLFYHIATNQTLYTLDSKGNTTSVVEKTYPCREGKSSVGSFGGGINFLDDICFLTKEGLYGLQYSDLDSDINSMNFVASRSKLVNPRLTRESNFKKASLEVYKGYLCILVDSHMYLADSRCSYGGNNGIEYEWFFFNHIECDNHEGCILKAYEGSLYFGTKGGQICSFVEGTYTDNEEPFENFIVLKSDNFDAENKLKTTSKKGGIAKFQLMNGSSVNIYMKSSNSDSKGFKYVTGFVNEGFSFNSFDFGNLGFLVGDNNYSVIRTKQKNFNELQVMLCGETNPIVNGLGFTKVTPKPFGFYSLTLEVFKGSYIKR